eukprot:TRINITY_DN99846_c0_g1_i2.p2 TRINITY_DN99846_c0_g1~~TRINITY_DN99846_c0_g1_i2.p2  ORF type:complete len:128 (-),score=1.65 TRINITY_DN99846_c0_g1_i2:345-728(-)
MASFFVGWLMETVADYQKFVFKSQPENKDKWIQSGLYRYCRYPNYFGEILVWWSFYGFNLAQGPITSYPWTIFSPLLTMLLLTQVSGIPLQESSKNKRYKENKAYQFYRNNTSLLIPWFPPNQPKSD